MCCHHEGCFLGDLVPNQKSMSPRLYGIVCFVVLSLGTVIAYFSSTSQKIWDIIHVLSSMSYMSKFVLGLFRSLAVSTSNYGMSRLIKFCLVVQKKPWDMSIYNLLNCRLFIPFVQSLYLVPLHGKLLFYVSLCSGTPVLVNFLSCPGCGEDFFQILPFCEELE